MPPFLGHVWAPSSKKGTARSRTAVDDKAKAKPRSLRWNQDSNVNKQLGSILFHLPREIRDLIWHFTLAPTELSQPTHFHIYDVVYDSCAYTTPTLESAIRRKYPTQISLLLTCRAVYIEALRYLYDNTDFVLVVLAGRPRPKESLRRLHGLGTIRDCETIFKRMRKVNIVIQPGKKPNAEKYATRIGELLYVADHFAGSKKLSLEFNLHRFFALCLESNARFETITHALYPLRDRPGPPIIIQACVFWPRSELDNDETFENLHAELPGSTLLPWSHAWKHTPCLTRGFEHVHRPFLNPTHSFWAKLADLSSMGPPLLLYIGMFPLTAPLTYYFYRKRKLDKGEW